MIGSYKFFAFNALFMSGDPDVTIGELELDEYELMADGIEQSAGDVSRVTIIPGAGISDDLQGQAETDLSPRKVVEDITQLYLNNLGVGGFEHDASFLGEELASELGEGDDYDRDDEEGDFELGLFTAGDDSPKSTKALGEKSIIVGEVARKTMKPEASFVDTLARMLDEKRKMIARLAELEQGIRDVGVYVHDELVINLVKQNDMERLLAILPYLKDMGTDLADVLLSVEGGTHIMARNIGSFSGLGVVHIQQMLNDDLTMGELSNLEIHIGDSFAIRTEEIAPFRAEIEKAKGNLKKNNGKK